MPVHHPLGFKQHPLEDAGSYINYHHFITQPLRYSKPSKPSIPPSEAPQRVPQASRSNASKSNDAASENDASKDGRSRSCFFTLKRGGGDPTKTQLSNFLGTPGEDYFKGNPKSLNIYFLVIWWGKGEFIPI